MASHLTQRMYDALRHALKHNSPLYVFLDEQEQVLDCDWFKGTDAAIRHAETLDAPVVNVLQYVGCSENQSCGPRGTPDTSEPVIEIPARYRGLLVDALTHQEYAYQAFYDAEPEAVQRAKECLEVLGLIAPKEEA